MIKRNLFALGAALSLLVAAAVGAYRLRTSPPTEPPSDMIKVGAIIGTSAKAVRTDLKRSWYDWNTLAKQVIIKRRERQFATQSFVEVSQELSTSYFVTDVRWRCDGSDELNQLFVSGVLSDGNSVIECWSFAYPPFVDSQGHYIPIDERRPPRVNRDQLYSGDTLGRVRTIEPDPNGRFLLFVTRETPALYRIDLPSGTRSLVYDQSTLPSLANVSQINVREHISEGRQFHLYAGVRWHYDPTLPPNVVVLRDGNNDAVFDSPEVVTPGQWAQYGYAIHASWVKICQ